MRPASGAGGLQPDPAGDPIRSGGPVYATDIARFADRNSRMRSEGTRSVLAAAAAARETLAALRAPAGLTVVIDDRAG
jgi:hypothetical protein